MADPPVSRIEIRVNSVPAGPALLGLHRPDLAGQIPSAQAPIAGFELELNLQGLVEAGQPASIEAMVETIDGTLRPLDAVTLKTLAVPQVRPLQMVTGARRGPGTGAARPGSELAVAVFTNDLLRAGSQLRLLEVLARLVERPGFSFTVFSPSDGPLRQELAAIGINVRFCAPYSYGSATGYTRVANQLARELIDGGFSVAWASTQISFIGLEAAAIAGLPSLYMIQQNQDLPIFWGRSRREGHVDPRVYDRAEHLFSAADRVVFVCEASRRTYRRLERNHNFTVVPNALDLEAIERFRNNDTRCEIRQRLDIDPGRRLILCSGVIAPHKGQTTLAQAFARVAGAHPDTLLALVGDIGNDYSAGLTAYLERTGLGERVRVLPLTGDIFDWYAAADLVVSPSQEEAQPSVVLEAMAFGVLVASTDVGGVAEVIEDGVNGLMCPPGDVAGMTRMLQRALSMKPDEIRAMTAASMLRVHRDHDVKLAARRIRTILKQVAGVPAPWVDATYLPHLSAGARAGFGRGDLEPLLAGLAGLNDSYERVGVDRALAIAVDMALTGAPRSASILDVGCSVGSISALLSEIGYRVTAIDSDAATTVQDWHTPAMLEQIRQDYSGPNWRFVPADLATFLQGSKDRFDCVLLPSVVSHRLPGFPYPDGCDFDAERTTSLLSALCGRVDRCIYLETPLSDEYASMPYDPSGEFSFPAWFITRGLATGVELVASTVANAGKPRRLYRVDVK